ncbi:MAG: hypothetical protein AAGC71_15230 [Pseudomonadota bacterium]
MNYSHRHNLVRPEQAGADRPFGIRSRLPATDPFTRLVGETWEHIDWYATREDRDRALARKRDRHGYYRTGDDVSVIYEAVERDSADRRAEK